MRILRFLNIGLALALVLFAVATYGVVPEQVPLHLDLSGAPTRMGDKGLLAWFGLSGIAVSSYLLIQFVSAQLPARPHWFNFSEKERFLQLPAEYRGPVVIEMRTMLEVVACGMLLTMGVVQVLMWRAATGRPTAGFTLIPLFAVLITPVALIWLSRVQNAVAEQEKRWRAEQPTAA
jgi:uncharacterized membrane protein